MISRLGASSLPPSPSGARALTSDEIFEPLPPIDYVLPNYVPAGTVHLVVAYAGTGKTWFLLDAACAVAYGGKWLDKFVCDQGSAIFLDWENGEHLIRRRIQLIARGYGKQSARRLAPYCDPGNLDSDEFEEWLLEIARFRSLVTIDPLRAAAPFGDENASEIRGVLDRVRRVARATNAAFLVAHHVGKGSSHTDGREMARGSSALMDAVDGALVLRFQKKTGNIKLEHAKCRHAQAQRPTMIRIDQKANAVRVLPADDDDDEESETGKSELRQSKIVDLLTTSPGLSGNAVRNRVGGRGESVRDELNVLVKKGTLVNVGSEARPEYRVRDDSDPQPGQGKGIHPAVVGVRR